MVYSISINGDSPPDYPGARQPVVQAAVGINGGIDPCANP